MTQLKTKLIFSLATLLVVCHSCSLDQSLRETQEVSIENSVPVEIAFSDRDDEKELVTLPNGMVVEKLDSIYILGGDMILPTRFIDSLYSDSTSLTKAASTGDFIKFWPKGIIYYEFAPNMTSVYRTAVIQGMNMWSSTTGVEFKVAHTGNRVYIQYNENSNSSELGYMKSGKQILNLANAIPGVAAHELGHAMGLIHEHQRANRDNHINIHTNNIKITKRHNYNKVASSMSYKDEMDYNSIMMYSSYNSFAKDETKPTMSKKDGSTWAAQRYYLSPSDIELVKFIYGPPYYKITSTKTKDNSYYQGNVDVIDEEYSNTIYFYSDKACKNKIAKTENPVQVRLRLVTKTRKHAGELQTTTKDYIYTIPAGTSSWRLPSTKDYIMYELGTETNCDRTYFVNYSVENVNL